MGAMHEFLVAIESQEFLSKYSGLDDVWDRRAVNLNEQLRAAGVPLQAAHFSTVWSLIFTQPSRYNWMLQFYLRAEGLALSWVGTGRLIFPIDLPDDAFAEIARRITAAAVAMHRDGWWWSAPELTNQTIRRRVRAETLRALGVFRAWGRSAPRASDREATSSTS